MTNEEFMRIVLDKLSNLEEGQTSLEQNFVKLEEGQEEIKKELKYIWDDIKRIDQRLSQQENEIIYLKRVREG